MKLPRTIKIFFLLTLKNEPKFVKKIKNDSKIIIDSIEGIIPFEYYTFFIQ